MTGKRRPRQRPPIRRNSPVRALRLGLPFCPGELMPDLPLAVTGSGGLGRGDGGRQRRALDFRSGPSVLWDSHGLTLLLGLLLTFGRGLAAD
jgi:hypothetical protein